MILNLYQIDAFTNKIFQGNPACVVPLDDWLPDEILLKIAKENAVAETAFFINDGDTMRLRWFTPEIEMDLCGHATLATAHCLKSILDHPNDRMIFKTLSGELSVFCENDLYHLDFPSRMPLISELPKTIEQALNILPKEVYLSRDYVLVYDSEDAIRNIQIDKHVFDRINLDPGGVVATALGENCDFVSRFFTPQASIMEDPVTGSAHCSLIPFWSERLKKKTLSASQLSERGGKLYCQDMGERVQISGQAVTYSKGQLWIDQE